MGNMFTTEHQSAVRNWLQAVEDDLIEAGKRHVVIHGSEGIFEWAKHGATDEPAEKVTVVLIEDIEDIMIDHGWDDLDLVLESGSIHWALQP
jgi:hypothetical protein